jgi:hypothetical protein
MKVIKTVSWPDSEKYRDAWDMDEPDSDKREKLYNEITACVTDWARKNEIRLDGSEYQHYVYAAPQDKVLIEIKDGDWKIETGNIPIVLLDDGREYAFQESMRSWGSLMYDIWGAGGGEFNDGSENDPMGYCIWAWTNPDQISMEKCRKCGKYYFNNTDFSKGILHMHDHSQDPNKNCRGIPVGPPRRRNIWSCGRFEDKGD